jgi:hypothetical protein
MITIPQRPWITRPACPSRPRMPSVSKVCPWPGTSSKEAGAFFGAPIDKDKLTALDGTGWELYHVEKDFAENHNLAATNKAKLIEMIATSRRDARERAHDAGLLHHDLIVCPTSFLPHLTSRSLIDLAMRSNTGPYRSASASGTIVAT